MSKDPIDRECGQCSASPGARCRSQDGRSLTYFHNKRLNPETQHRPERNGCLTTTMRKQMAEESLGLLGAVPSSIAARRLPPEEIARAVSFLPLRPPGR
jgi:hypothetical protein